MNTQTCMCRCHQVAEIVEQRTAKVQELADTWYEKLPTDPAIRQKKLKLVQEVLAALRDPDVYEIIVGGLDIQETRNKHV